MPKTSPIRSSVSTEHRLVTDTDSRDIASTRASISSRAGKNRRIDTGLNKTMMRIHYWRLSALTWHDFFALESAFIEMECVKTGNCNQQSMNLVHAVTSAGKWINETSVMLTSPTTQFILSLNVKCRCVEWSYNATNSTTAVTVRDLIIGCISCCTVSTVASWNYRLTKSIHYHGTSMHQLRSRRLNCNELKPSFSFLSRLERQKIRPIL